MKIKRFIIVEKGHHFFFTRRILYGYSLQNQIIYKVKFGKSLEEAFKFYSEIDANKFLDELPYTDYAIHFCYTDCKSPLKLANLVIEPISIIYDT